jgi:hypothetical protein
VGNVAFQTAWSIAKIARFSGDESSLQNCVGPVHTPCDPDAQFVVPPSGGLFGRTAGRKSASPKLMGPLGPQGFVRGVHLQALADVRAKGSGFRKEVGWVKRSDDPPIDSQTRSRWGIGRAAA